LLRLAAVLIMISPLSFAAQGSSGSQPASASPQASKPECMVRRRVASEK